MAETASASPSMIGVPRTIFGFIIIAMFILPRLPFFDPPHLFTPVDRTFLHWYIGISAIIAYLAFFGFFMWGNLTVANAGLGIIIGILSFMIAALCGGAAYLSGSQFYSYYKLVYLPHEQREMLYAVPSISVRGRGGDRAWINPYGLRTWGLPLSGADYRAYRTGTLAPPRLCYRVTEFRNGSAIGIVAPSERNTPDALVHCSDTDERRVDVNTPYRI